MLDLSLAFKPQSGGHCKDMNESSNMLLLRNYMHTLTHDQTKSVGQCVGINC